MGGETVNLNKSERDAYFQNIRGICIICVALIHCKTGIGYTNDSVWNYYYWVVLRSLINFPVAVFIFLTAYFTNVEKVKEPYSYYLNRIKRLIIPFLVWSSFYTAENMILHGFDVNFLNEILKLLTGQSKTGLYFIIVLIQLTVITPYMVKYINRKHFKLISLGLVLALLSVYYANYIVNDTPKNLMTASLFPSWLVFYYIGIYLKVNKKDCLFRFTNNPKTDISIGIAFLLFAIFFGVLESWFLQRANLPASFMVSQIKVSSILYSISVINVILLIKKYAVIKSHKLILNLGNHSFGIYFVHIFWVRYVGKLVDYIPFIDNILPVYQLV